jgi:uncharacterized protein
MTNTPAAGRPSRDRAFTVFAVATAVGLLHALDDALLNRQPGVPVDQHLWALLVVTALAVPAVLVFRRSGTGTRAGLALVVGVPTLVNGSLHVIHIAVDEVSGSDVTGVLAAVAGAVLVVMAAGLPFVHRGSRGLSPGRRWAVRGAVMVGVAVLVPFVLLPVSVGIGQTHLFRIPIGEPPDDRFADVTFESSDGLALSGWYARSSNRAAVLLVNTAGGDRLGSVEHARMLADHGYGVLLYDARGAGDSEGTPNGYGWGWERDVDGALDYLSSRPDVEPDRVGALGLSTGADVLIAVAAEDRRVKAVVSDGATAWSLADLPEGDPLGRAFMTPVLTSAALFSGSRPGPALEDAASRVSPTPMLLIAAGSLAGEIDLNTGYAEAAKEPVELWTLPDSGHTAAIRDEADAYERRVVGHFDAALLGTEVGALARPAD